METVTIHCETCPTTFEAGVLDIAGRKVCFAKFCEACTEKQQQAKETSKQEAFIAGRKRAWEEVCPEFYRTEGIVAALPAEKTAAVRTAMKTYGACLIHGPSGAFKTTAMLHGAVKKLVWDRQPVLFTTAMEWKPKASKAAMEGRTEAFLRPFIVAPHLFLDDLGNMGGTPASIEALHNLLEQRMRRKLPLMATTQYTGEALIGKIGSSEAGTAIVRRLALITRQTIKFT